MTSLEYLARTTHGGFCWNLKNTYYAIIILLLIAITPAARCQQANNGISKRDGIGKFERILAGQDLLSNASNNVQQVGKQMTSERLNLIEADENGLYLMGIFDIHQSVPRSPLKCGSIDLDSGETNSRRAMQNMEAFLYTIEQINQDPDLLPGIRLGSLVLDTCSSYLQTNQQLANLLLPSSANQLQAGNVLSNQMHPANHQPGDEGANQRSLVDSRQILGIVADNHDWQSVETVASIASPLGLGTFVTQSRSTKLAEIARRHKLLANQQQKQHHLPPTKSSELEGYLSELLGIGRMFPSENERDLSSLIGMMDNPNGNLTDANSSDITLTSSKGDSVEFPSEDGGLDEDDLDDSQLHDAQRPLMMLQMATSNELIAESIVSLCEQMNWNLVSLVYETDDQDLVDLHDELIRQLMVKSMQFALDFSISAADIAAYNNRAPSETDNNGALSAMDGYYAHLMRQLAAKAQIGSRVVITLVGPAVARNLLINLAILRSTGSSASTMEDRRSNGSINDPTTVDASELSALQSQVNSLLWLTIADRDPYYSYATTALGTIAISSSSSLFPEFRHHYDHLSVQSNVVIISESFGGNKTGVPNLMVRNKWWAEYMRSILLKHQGKEVSSLLASECAKWQEPSSSSLHKKCNSLSLSSLDQVKTGTEVNNRQETSGDILAHDSIKQLRVEKPRVARQQHLLQHQQGHRTLSIKKYLAGGWEHNGIDVINSVLAIANGLESVRRSLCPDQASGICSRMRQLLPNSATDRNANLQIQSQQPQIGLSSIPMPTISEIVFNELSRISFGLSDNRLFNLGASVNIDSTIPPMSTISGQKLEGRLKFYNLRVLRETTVGFVKFARYDQQDGLVMNLSKPLHYNHTLADGSHGKQMSIGGAFKPIVEVVSTCEDANKCLLASSLHQLSLMDQDNEQQRHQSAGQAKSVNSKPVSEEELASSVNSLFKLDHPAIISGDVNPPSQHSDDPGVFQLRAPSVSASGWLHSSWHHIHQDDNNNNSELMQAEIKRQKTIRGELIVLLALHNHLKLASGTKTKRVDNQVINQYQSECPVPGLHQLDTGDAYQQLVALAHVQNQQSIRHRQQVLQSTAQPTITASDEQLTGNSNSSTPIEQFELDITVIDYCANVELAEEKLARHLEMASKNGSWPVAIIDYDHSLGELVDRHLARLRHSFEQQPPPMVHLTIAPKSHINNEIRSNYHDHKSAQNQKQLDEHLHLHLLPNKLNEIQALVSLISSIKGWQMVHLIYTGRHQYRDEFVRRANEANICVSKMIWIPEATVQANESIAKELQDEQVKWTRQVFEHKLNDYIGPGNSDDKLNLGLNGTRILVVLASEQVETNWLIEEAATKSMLNDYIWITSHEWLEASKAKRRKIDNINNNLRPELMKREHHKQGIHYLLATQVENYESREFKHYFSQLSPANHAPIPDKLFDQFWQEKFSCRLPISSENGKSFQQERLPLCSALERLDWTQVSQNERVHQTIQAVESIYETYSVLNEHNKEQQESSSNLDKITRKQSGFAKLFRGLLKSRLRHLHHQAAGFHIIHKLLARSADNLNTSRRVNSRNLALSGNQMSGDDIDQDDDDWSQLVRVGLWRNPTDGLVLLTRKSLLDFPKDNEKMGALNGVSTKRRSQLMKWLQLDESDDLQMALRIANSFDRLASIRSICSDTINQQQQQQQQSLICQLCQHQIEQTMALIQQEEQKLVADGLVAPQAISSLGQNSWLTSFVRVRNSSSLDNLDKMNDVQINEDTSIPGLGATEYQGARRLDGDIQASASSLFDSIASKQVLDGTRQAYAGFSSIKSHQPSNYQNVQLRRLSAIVLSIVSLVGVVCTVFSLYSNMFTMSRGNQKRASYGIGHQTCSGEDVYHSAGMESKIQDNDDAQSVGSVNKLTYRKSCESLKATANDSLMLIGLLMLYSINVAYLLPATLGVCYFRRVGLALSYIVILTAILVETLALLRFSKRFRCCLQNDFNFALDATSPLETGSFEDANINRTTNSGSTVIETVRGRVVEITSTNLNNTNLSLGLILIQLLITLVWLSRQPPEPTLYLGCWLCSSPNRNRLLFLYEPLFGLIPSAIILFLNLLLATQALMRISQCSNWLTKSSQQRQQLSLASRERSVELERQFRQAKSLVMTISLLALTWTIASLIMISSSNKIPLQNNHHHQTTSHLHHRNDVKSSALLAATDDINLVYANITSGAIIFFLLFVYRLKLLKLVRLPIGCNGNGNARNTSSTSDNDLPLNHQQSTYYSTAFANHHQPSSETNSNQPTPNSVLFLISGTSNESSKSTSRDNEQLERVRLQHLNSSYGTCSSQEPLNEQWIAGSKVHNSYQKPNDQHKKNGDSFRAKIKNKLGGAIRSSSKHQITTNWSDRGNKNNIIGLSKLHRRQSNGSVASSTTKLMRPLANAPYNYDSDNSLGDDDQLDNISCAMSLASNSTSQLQGNDLYPIDCSIQFESGSTEPVIIYNSISSTEQQQTDAR